MYVARHLSGVHVFYGLICYFAVVEVFDTLGSADASGTDGHSGQVIRQPTSGCDKLFQQIRANE